MIEENISSQIPVNQPIQEFFKKKNKLLFYLLILLLIFGVGIYLWQKGLFGSVYLNDWKTYSNDIYSIIYPKDLSFPDDNNFPDEIVFKTNDFELDMTNGNIKSGYIVTIYGKDMGFNYDNLDSCHKNPVNWIEESKRCLLGYGNSMILDYRNGEVVKERLIVNKTPAIKYQFTSTSGRNNGIGLVLDNQEKSYVVMIGYKDFKDWYIFDKILNSFKVKGK